VTSEPSCTTAQRPPRKARSAPRSRPGPVSTFPFTPPKSLRETTVQSRQRGLRASSLKG
jgi:hypothetical protein